ncbi:type II toxin-antitoxin system VapC family toxin [Alkalicaulis satelles]|uniref:Ribonuclease VapC n=1 Tax=Alkalicaulis satelles TaxID=2609175 RepID=A0A5M6ZMH5_9PROT|nr:PIN domain-containing protein [Alkalicaulis satelles]KAA5804897.1 type II toxin-antitoxin system VapC family toxin [Alkalicaulis satelles]
MSAQSKLIVLDASAALAFILPSNMTQASTAFFDTIEAASLTAPHIFMWETLNILARHSLHARRDLDRDVAALERLEIEIQGALDISQLSAVLALAMKHTLSLFDAAYLALAAELDAPLATRDAGLLRAAALAGAPCLDLR